MPVNIYNIRHLVASKKNKNKATNHKMGCFYLWTAKIYDVAFPCVLALSSVGNFIFFTRKWPTSAICTSESGKFLIKALFRWFSTMRVLCPHGTNDTVDTASPLTGHCWANSCRKWQQDLEQDGSASIQENSALVLHKGSMWWYGCSIPLYFMPMVLHINKTRH